MAIIPDDDSPITLLHDVHDEPHIPVIADYLLWRITLYWLLGSSPVSSGIESRGGVGSQPPCSPTLLIVGGLALYQ